MVNTFLSFPLTNNQSNTRWQYHHNSKQAIFTFEHQAMYQNKKASEMASSSKEVLTCKLQCDLLLWKMYEANNVCGILQAQALLTIK